MPIGVTNLALGGVDGVSKSIGWPLGNGKTQKPSKFSYRIYAVFLQKTILGWESQEFRGRPD